MLKSINEEIPLKKALIWILLVTLMLSGSAVMGWLYCQHAKKKRLQDDQYRILAIVQNTPQKESLKTGYLAELLNLSLDKPVNLYLFNSLEGEKKLLACPLIKHAAIKKILPGTLYIYYEVRVPFALLANGTNTGLDEEGNSFPFNPFFTPKRLPSIRLGTPIDLQWGPGLKENKELSLAIHLINFFNQENRLNGSNFYLKEIDAADAYAESYGQRQIVITLENQQGSPLLLRLNTEHFKQNLTNFFALQKTFNPGQLPEIVDFRIPQLAFIKNKMKKGQ
ncbi:MAG: hypothetical protein H0V82_09245 [Candidatus Protochlamydia sp.]|nr:hypothetical protein [Candidatus Protochlamydia sp.]